MRKGKASLVAEILVKWSCPHWTRTSYFFFSFWTWFVSLSLFTTKYNTSLFECVYYNHGQSNSHSHLLLGGASLAELLWRNFFGVTSLAKTCWHFFWFFSLSPVAIFLCIKFLTLPHDVCMYVMYECCIYSMLYECMLYECMHIIIIASILNVSSFNTPRPIKKLRSTSIYWKDLSSYYAKYGGYHTFKNNIIQTL